MNIILFGAPGSGKGTQAITLSKELDLQWISLGDILRKEVKDATPVGQEVAQYMEKGLLVPDELVAKVIDASITDKSFILDGYPRNVAQAQKLDEILDKRGTQIDKFINLEVDQKTVVERLSKRRVCKSCSRNYHLVNMPSKQEGICDDCASPLIQRKDDTNEVILKRWEVFNAKSTDLIDFYKKQGKLVTLSGSEDRFLVFEKIKKLVQ